MNHGAPAFAYTHVVAARGVPKRRGGDVAHIQLGIWEQCRSLAVEWVDCPGTQFDWPGG